MVTADEATEAFGLSLTTALVSTVLCVVLGLPLSLWMVDMMRRHPRIGDALQLIIYAPLVLSPVVSGLALVFLWGRHGLVGEWLDDTFGLRVAFTSLAVIVVQVFVSMPFFVSTTVTSLRGVPPVVQEAARVDGASRWQVLRHITVPLALPGIVVGTVLGFAPSTAQPSPSRVTSPGKPGRSRCSSSSA